MAGDYPRQQGSGAFFRYNIALPGGCKLARVLQQLTLLARPLEQAGLNRRQQPLDLSVCLESSSHLSAIRKMQLLDPYQIDAQNMHVFQERAD